MPGSFGFHYQPLEMPSIRSPRTDGGGFRAHYWETLAHAPLAAGQGVAVEYAGEQYGEELPRRHDRREEQRPVGADGVRDEQLPCTFKLPGF